MKTNYLLWLMAITLTAMNSQITSADAATLIVTNTSDSGPGSLRQAINDANLAPGSTIAFNIPTTDPNFSAGVFTIQPASALPMILAPGTIIDGTTQTSFTGDTNAAGPEIELNGSLTGTFSVEGLQIITNGCTIRGLVIDGFNDGLGIIGPATTDNRVEGCYIGTNATGTDLGSGTFGGNDANGVLISSGAHNNIIGGTAPGAGNLISGNTNGMFGFAGVRISGPGANGNIVQGNYIGTNAAGTAALVDLNVLFDTYGVQVLNGAQSNIIGGTVPAERNVISGNFYGVGVEAQTANTIGRGGPPTLNVIQGNYIGTDATGTTAVPNFFGIYMSESNYNTIGGTAPGAGNVISGNAVGIDIEASIGNTLEGNFIGTDATGTGALGNGDSVLVFDDTFTTIGGVGAGQGNVIAFNRNGMLIDGSSASNPVRGNTIYGNVNGLCFECPNARLGIDLGGDGVTPNDPCDGDMGPNNLQNYPVITNVAVAGGTTTITGTLNSMAASSFTLDFYSNSEANPSGFGEGETYVGSTDVMTDTSCNASFNVNIPSAPTIVFYTATATDAAGNTSEFSQAVSVLGFVKAVSRKTHGSAGTFDINLPPAGSPAIECRTGGPTGDHQVVFTFAAPVTVGSATCGGNPATTSTSGNEITVNCTAVPNAQTITISLLGVNDGTNTGDLSVPMGVLIGDVNGSGRVDAADVSLVRQQTLQQVTPDNLREDINASGRIDAADVSIARQQTLTSLP